MIDELRLLAIFARVAETGSFRQAARSLGLSPSVVSQHVATLEKRLGVTLLYRSTRSLSLTAEGRTLFASTRQMLHAAEQGLSSVSEQAGAPRGNLRLSVPAMLPGGPVSDGLMAFAKKHPGVELTICYSDTRSDLIRDGFDLAIRMGWLKDSTLKARKLGEFARLLVASPDYAAEQAPAGRPRDLEDWNWIRFAARLDAVEFAGPDGGKEAARGRSHVTVDNVFAMRDMAKAGLGLAALPAYLVAADIAAGRLVRVLPEWTLPRPGIYAVWPMDARRESLTARLVSTLVEFTAQ